MPNYRCELSVLRAALVFLCISLASSAVAGPTDPAPAQPTPHAPSHEKVFLLRGFTNVLSPGIDQLAEELRKRNVNTTIANHAFSAALAQEALDDCKSGRVNSIVLVGHSFGASAALSMAETLKQAGVQVALVVTFDPVTQNFVPANVRHLENFYLSDGVGKPVQKDPAFRGLLKNVDMKSNVALGHISVTTFPAIQKQVLKDILAANTRCNKA